MTVDDNGAVECRHTVYRKFGFRRIKEVRDPGWIEGVTRERYPDATEEERGLLRVMLLTESADSGLLEATRTQKGEKDVENDQGIRANPPRAR